MNKLLASLTFGLATWSGAVAAEETSAFYPLIGFGLTFGGTTLANVQYVNGNSCNIHAGGLGDVYAGVDYRRQPVSVQVTAGYHFDTCDGSNGSLRFSAVTRSNCWRITVSARTGVREAECVS